MKIQTRYFIVNTYTVLACLLLFFLMFFSWGIDSGVFNVILHFNDYNGPYTLREYIHIISGFESYPELGYRFVQLLIPVFPVIIIIPFLNIVRTLPMEYPRASSYIKAIVPKIIKCLFFGCFALFLSFLCFLLIGRVMLGLPEASGKEELFTEIFGNNFYRDHMFCFFVVQGFLRFFIFPLVYGLFGISISFLSSKKHLCILIPVSYYTILSIVCACLNSAFSPRDFIYFSPSYTLMSTARPYVNGFMVLAPLLPVLVFSVTVITRDFIKKHGRGDVLAVS